MIIVETLKVFKGYLNRNQAVTLKAFYLSSFPVIASSWQHIRLSEVPSACTNQVFDLYIGQWAARTRTVVPLLGTVLPPIILANQNDPREAHRPSYQLANHELT